MSGDTIAAISTAPGAGGIAIVRLSGPRAEQLLRAVFRPASEKADMSGRRLTYGAAVDGRGEVLDEVMAVLLHAPRTYTREDMAEIHCHGGGACASAVLARFLALGARAAEPGEFTRRAYENGRIDLSGAEAVMQLIGAQGEAARRAALRQMRGGVTGFVTGAVEKLTELLSRIQAAVDFPEEVDEAVVGAEARVELEALAGELKKRADPRRARMLREGASVVLCGRPNVGKSSLMNALLSAERAIVTDIPGTTRDVLSERMVLDGKVVRLSDTAGIRESEDAIERMGVARAQGEVEAADVALLVLDASQPLAAEDAALLKQVDERYIVCLNKGDLPAVLTAADVEAFLAGSAGKEGQGDDRAGVSACCAGEGATDVVQGAACAGEGVRDALQGAACAGSGGGIISPCAVCAEAGGGVVKAGTADQGAACAGEGVKDALQCAACAGVDTFPASGKRSAGDAGRRGVLAAGGCSVPVVSLCAATGEGVEALLSLLRQRLDVSAGEEECFHGRAAVASGAGSGGAVARLCAGACRRVQSRRGRPGHPQSLRSSGQRHRPRRLRSSHRRHLRQLLRRQVTAVRSASAVGSESTHTRPTSRGGCAAFRSEWGGGAHRRRQAHEQGLAVCGVLGNGATGERMPLPKKGFSRVWTLERVRAEPAVLPAG